LFIEDFDTWDMTGYYLYSKLLRSGVSAHIGTGGPDDRWQMETGGRGSTKSRSGSVQAVSHSRWGPIELGLFRLVAFWVFWWPGREFNRSLMSLYVKGFFY